jgi:sterol 3beta-glucosyltransferase
MQITIFTLGSHGDIRPYVPLSLGLQRAGYTIRFASFNAYRTFIESHELEFFSISGDPLSTMNSQAGQAWMRSGRNVLATSRNMRRALINGSLMDQFNDALKACHGSDAVIYSFMGAAAYHAAEKLGIPSIFALLQPFTRSRKMPSIAFPELPLGGRYNLLTHWIGEQAIWQIARSPIDRWRLEALGLPALPWYGPFNLLYEQEKPYLYGFSPSVVPRPPDWPDWHHISGYWFLDRDPDWKPPEALVRFLDSGPKPISIGFGSMSGQNAGNLLEIAIDTVKATNQRAVLLGGWAALAPPDLPDTMFMIDAVPHNWLFPRMAAIVHHGGAGTTAAGLRAGVPSILVPFFADQPFWGRRVHALGVGPKPLQRKSLSTKNLAEAITNAVEDETMHRNAVSIGERIRAENGVENAIDFIQDYFG